jgi:hypothetical protein
VRGRVLMDNLAAAALPDHAQRGAALGRPAADDAQQQAVDRPDPSRQSLRQHRSRPLGWTLGGRIGATPCRDDRRGSQRGAMRRAGDVDDGCLGCFGCFGFPPIPVVRAMIKLGPAVRPTMGQPFSIPRHPPENCERQTPTQVGRPAARVRSSKADISASDVPPAVMGSKAIGRYVRKIGAIFKEFQ